jgi:hypothetical protein
MFTRRAAFPLAASAVLAACTPSTPTTPGTLDPQVLADAMGIVNGLATALPQIMAADPKLLTVPTYTTIMQSLHDAQTLLANLSASTPAAAGATTLITVETDINDALNAVAPVLPSAATTYPGLQPFVIIFDSAIALLPIIENFINTAIPTATPPKSVRRSNTPPSEARRSLHIPVVK